MAEHELNKIVDDDGEVFNLRDSTKQPTADRVTAWGSTPSDTKYPSEKLVKTSLDAKVSSITKNGNSITPTNGVADIGSMPVTRGETAGTVQEIIQAVRVKAGGSLGSVNVRASTVGSLSIPAKWYNFIWLPHQSGRDSGDNQHYGTLILTPLTESPDVFLIEGSGLNGSSPTYRAKRLAYYDHTHSNLVPEGDNRSVSTIPNDYSNTFVFRGIKNNSAIDSPSSDTYSYVIGLRGYQNNSGGMAHEIAFNNSGVFVRSGSTTSWTAWGKLVTDETLFLYANLGWGGKFRTSLSPVDVYLFYSQNAFFGLKPSAVNVEYSNDGGTTWTDYGLTDDQKRQLFSQYNSCNLYCGKAVHVHPGYTGSLGTYHDLSDENIADQRLRITLCCLSNAAAGTTDQTDKWIYCNLRRLAVYMSTQSASKGPTHFKITGRRKPDFVAGNDVWRDLGDYGILGDSGWNSVPCLNDKKENKITFGNSFDEQYTQLRFEIWSESLNTTPNSGQTGDLLIQKILGFSELLWTNNTTNSNMATYGAPYTVNPLNGVTNFSKGITSGVAIPIGSGGTGATSAIGAEYNILNQVADIDTTINGDRKIALCNQTKSVSNGVFRWLKLSNVWTWIKGLLSSESGVNISGSSTSCTGNAATATALSAGADRTKLDGIAAGAEVNVQSDWNQATTTADDYIKNKPTIPSGTQLVYDCGTGSTSTTDFDNALAAFNAGNWVIIHSSGNTYHCVGTYNSGLRFKQIANETASIKVNTLNWTRGSAPSVGTQLEPSMPGHTHSQYVEKSGDTMSGNLTISKGANQGDTKFVASRTDTGTTGWFGVGDGGKNHGVYSESAYANTNNDVDKYTKGWIVRTDENGYSSLVGKVDGLFSKSFGDSDTLMGMKRCLLGYSFDLKDTYTHVSATAIIEARLYSAGVSGGSITMLFNASARGDVGSYYRLQVISYNNWNVNNVCPVLIVQQSSATAKRIYLGLVSGGPASTTLRTFSFSEIKVLPINGTAEFTWEFGWDTNDFNSNTMTMIKPYVYPRAQIGTAIGSSSSPLYVKNDGDFATANLIDRAVGVKDAGRADAPASSDATVKLGWSNSDVPACTPDGTSTYSAGQTVGTTKHLVTVYEYNGVAYYKDVQAANVKVGDSVKWGGYKIQVGSVGSDSSTIYFT